MNLFTAYLLRIDFVITASGLKRIELTSVKNRRIYSRFWNKSNIYPRRRCL